MSPGSHGLQIRGGDRRAFNPDRDMVWALPRLFRRALETLGEDIDINKFRAMVEARGIDCDEFDNTALYDALSQVIKDVSAYFNALRSDPRLLDKAQPFFDDVFRKYAPNQQIRLFLSDILVSRIFAELPTWFATIAPRSPNDPIPSVDEVEAAADELLSRLNPSAGEESDHE